MAADAPRNLPRLGAGSLDQLLACPRRLADHLKPEDERPSGRRAEDGPFRLRNELRAALHAAHRTADDDGVPVGDMLDGKAPRGLSTEERAMFSHAIEAYADAHGDDGATLTSIGLDTLQADGPGGGHVLTGQPFLVVRTAEGEIELRTLHLGADPRRRVGDLPITSDVVNARLITKTLGITLPRAANDRLVRVARLGIRPSAESWHTEVRVDDLDRLRTRVLAAVTEATAPGVTPEARPGYWCSGCASLRDCPAVPQEPFGDILERTGTSA